MSAMWGWFVALRRLVQAVLPDVRVPGGPIGKTVTSIESEGVRAGLPASRLRPGRLTENRAG